MPQEPMAGANDAPPHDDPQEGDLKWLGMPGQPNQAQQIFVVYWESCGPGVLYVKSGDSIALWKTHGTVIDQSFRSPGLDPPNPEDHLSSVGCEIPLVGEPGEIVSQLPNAGDVLMCRNYKATNKLTNNKVYRNLQMQQINSPCVLFRQPQGGATDETSVDDLVAWSLNRGEETEVTDHQRQLALRLLRWSSFRMRQEGCCLNILPTPLANLPVVTDPDRLSSDVICQVQEGVHQIGEPPNQFNQIIVIDPTIEEPIPVCLVGQIWDKTIKLLCDAIEVNGWVRIRNCNVNQHGGKHARGSQVTPIPEWCKNVVEITGEEVDVMNAAGQGVLVPGNQNQQADQNQNANQNADANQAVPLQNQQNQQEEEEIIEEDPLDIAARILGDVDEDDGFDPDEELEQASEQEQGVERDEDGNIIVTDDFLSNPNNFFGDDDDDDDDELDETQNIGNVFAPPQQNNASGSNAPPNTQLVPETGDAQETLQGNQRYGFRYRGNLPQQNQNEDAIDDELSDDQIEDSDEEVLVKRARGRPKSKAKAKGKAKGKAKAGARRGGDGTAGARKKRRND